MNPQLHARYTETQPELETSAIVAICIQGQSVQQNSGVMVTWRVLVHHGHLVTQS